MKAKIIQKSIVTALLLGSSAAMAGGPLYLQGPNEPLRYGGPVSVYTDLGDLGAWSNETADNAVAFAWNQWSSVSTSSFVAGIEGDFSDVGLSDIDGSNAHEVIGTFNGGGIHVIYDHDGSVLRDFFGVGYGVLGIASPDFVAAEGSTEITESWVVLNGSVVTSDDQAAIDGFSGVITHESGHSINLAHSQTNGAIFFFGDNSAPGNCDGSAYKGPAASVNDIETMYPFISTAQTGAAASTVDVLDDRVSLSNLYPAEGWPGDFGAIAGKIRRGGGSNHDEISGINVIARNVDNPFFDAVSALSGDQTQGWAGKDGAYRFNGLTAGAQYVVYVDDIAQGGFSTVPAYLPGPEEYFNGSNESANAETDSVCDATPITASAGTSTKADIAFNHYPGAPVLTMIDFPGLLVTSIADKGDQAVGFVMGAEVGFAWDQHEGSLEGFTSPLAPTISGNGQLIAGTGYNDEGVQVSGYWMGNDANDQTQWSDIGTLPGTVGCYNSWSDIWYSSSAWGMSNDGNFLTGQNWTDCDQINAYLWNKQGGMMELPFTDRSDGTLYHARGNDVSKDGRTVAGFETWTFGRAAVVWTDGVPEWESLLQDVTYYSWQLGEIVTESWPVGEALAVSNNGEVVVGHGAWDQNAMANVPWMWTRAGGLELIEGIPCIDRTVFQFKCWGEPIAQSAVANGVSADGGVVVGHTTWSFFDPIDGFIWTRELGVMELQQFLEIQNVLAVDNWQHLVATSVSSDGRSIGGWGGVPVTGDPWGFQSEVWGFTISIDKVDICHKPSSKNPVTLQVAFPDSMDTHLAHGDRFGACES